MTGSWPPQDFPDLPNHRHAITSPQSNRYNCIGWAASNNLRWWWPDPLNIGYWPASVPREETIDAFMRAYGSLGYIQCSDGVIEQGFEKIAIYALRSGNDLMPAHAARQLTDGRWTSKLGPCEDIEHDTLEALNGPLYGAPVCFLRRPTPP